MLYNPEYDRALQELVNPFDPQALERLLEALAERTRMNADWVKLSLSVHAEDDEELEFYVGENIAMRDSEGGPSDEALAYSMVALARAAWLAGQALQHAEGGREELADILSGRMLLSQSLADSAQDVGLMDDDGVRARGAFVWQTMKPLSPDKRQRALFRGCALYARGVGRALLGLVDAEQGASIPPKGRKLHTARMAESLGVRAEEVSLALALADCSNTDLRMFCHGRAGGDTGELASALSLESVRLARGLGRVLHIVDDAGGEGVDPLKLPARLKLDPGLILLARMAAFMDEQALARHSAHMWHTAQTQQDDDPLRMMLATCAQYARALGIALENAAVWGGWLEEEGGE